MAFPSNPNNGDKFNRFGREYSYDSNNGKWSAVKAVASSTLASYSINTLSDIDLQTTAPQDGETLVWNTAQSKFVPGAASGSGTTPYATLAELPLSGNETGAQAFVSETNRLYIWNGSGWYNIALINTAPSIIQGGIGGYSLATDGTPTVITLQANDPEGIPITWGYTVTSGTLGTTATVTQADNVFTITPGTVDPTDAGTFQLTFTASDGVNVATDVNNFTLAFGLSYTTIETFGTTWGSGYSLRDSSNSISASYDPVLYRYTLATDGVTFAGIVPNANFLQAVVPDANGGVWFKVGFNQVGGGINDRKFAGWGFTQTTTWNSAANAYSMIELRGDGNNVNNSANDESGVYGWSTKFNPGARSLWYSALYFNATTGYSAYYHSTDDINWQLWADKTFPSGHNIQGIFVSLWRRTVGQIGAVQLLDVDATVRALI